MDRNEVQEMTPDEFKKRMSLIKENFAGDTEIIHLEADTLLCRALIEAGYADGVEIFNSFDRWYA